LCQQLSAVLPKSACLQCPAKVQPSVPCKIVAHPAQDSVNFALKSLFSLVRILLLA
jgi:hypothetical protein